jgi:acyl dehydratase
MTIQPASLTGSHNYFEDFNVGDVYQHARGKTVEGLENVLLTNLVLNTAQAHFNEHLAESLPQKHRITFGGVTASIVIGLAMQDTGENAIEEVGLDKVRFRVPVLHGDTLYAFTEVVAKDDNPDDSRGHDNVGLVHFRHWGVNQRDETVFEGERRVLLKKRGFRPVAFDKEASALATPTAAPTKTRAKVRARVAKRARAGAKVALSSKAGKSKSGTRTRRR